jgi:hypothetical protein
MISDRFKVKVSQDFLESIPDIFHHDLPTILVEMIQNSRRAGATKVAIHFDDQNVTYSDNGKGCDLRLMLGTFADKKRWDADTVEKENPAGMGMHSLYSVSLNGPVEIHSGRQSVTLSPENFLGKKIITVSESDENPVDGVIIRFVTAKPFLTEQIRLCLRNNYNTGISKLDGLVRHSPVSITITGKEGFHYAGGNIPFVPPKDIFYEDEECAVGVSELSSWRSNYLRVNFMGCIAEIPSFQSWIIPTGVGLVSVGMRIDVKSVGKLRLKLPDRSEVRMSDSVVSYLSGILGKALANYALSLSKKGAEVFDFVTHSGCDIGRAAVEAAGKVFDKEGSGRCRFFTAPFYAGEGVYPSQEDRYSLCYRELKGSGTKFFITQNVPARFVDALVLRLQDPKTTLLDITTEARIFESRTAVLFRPDCSPKLPPKAKRWGIEGVRIRMGTVDKLCGNSVVVANNLGVVVGLTGEDKEGGNRYETLIKDIPFWLVHDDIVNSSFSEFYAYNDGDDGQLDFMDYKLVIGKSHHEKMMKDPVVLKRTLDWLENFFVPSVFCCGDMSRDEHKAEINQWRVLLEQDLTNKIDKSYAEKLIIDFLEENTYLSRNLKSVTVSRGEDTGNPRVEVELIGNG